MVAVALRLLGIRVANATDTNHTDLEEHEEIIPTYFMVCSTRSAALPVHRNGFCGELYHQYAAGEYIYLQGGSALSLDGKGPDSRR